MCLACRWYGRLEVVTRWKVLLATSFAVEEEEVVSTLCTVGRFLILTDGRPFPWPWGPPPDDVVIPSWLQRQAKNLIASCVACCVNGEGCRSSAAEPLSMSC